MKLELEVEISFAQLIEALCTLLQGGGCRSPMRAGEVTGRPIKLTDKEREALDLCIELLRDHGYLPLFDIDNIEAAFAIDPERAIPAMERGIAEHQSETPIRFLRDDGKIDERKVERWARRIEAAALKMRT